MMERRCRGSAAPQLASSPPGVAAGKCRAPPGLWHWAWAQLVPASSLHTLPLADRWPPRRSISPSALQDTDNLLSFQNSDS